MSNPPAAPPDFSGATATAKPNTKLRRIPIASVAGLLVVTSLLGQLLGFLRTKLVNGNFSGNGLNTDPYFAAFTIPDFFFFTVAAGALGVAFMPFLSDRLQKGDRKGMWELSTSLLNLLALIMLGVGVIIFFFAEPLIKYVVAPDLSPEQTDQAAAIMRFLAFNPFLFTISGVLTSTQQTLGRFFFYAIAPLFYNLSIIASIYVFKESLGIVGLGAGALIGGILQLIIVIIGLRGLSFVWKPIIAWKNKDFRQVLRQLPPRSLDQGIDQLMVIVETNRASFLGPGNISHYNNAYILHTAPILLLGTAISTAAFPRMNQRLSQGRPDLFRKDFLRTLRAMIWIAMPVVVVCFFGRGYLARMIFSQDAPQIAIIFGFLTVAILFRTIYAIVSRWFYAQKDTKTPLFVSVFAIALNIVLAYVLARPENYGIAGLAMAQSIVATAEVAVLFIIMLIRDRGLFRMEFWGGVGRIISVTGFTLAAASIVVALYPLNSSDGGLVVTMKLAIITAVTFTVHVGLSAVFGLEEVRPIIRRLKNLVLKPIRISY